MIIKKDNHAPQIKTNLIEQSLKPYLKFNKKKDTKKNKNKISPKIHINNDKQKKIKSNDIYNDKDINKSENINKKEKSSFELYT